MGWSTDWFIPRGVLTRGEIESALGRAITHVAGATLQLTERDDKGAELIIAFRGRDGRDYTGSLELRFQEPDDGYSASITQSKVWDLLMDLDPSLEEPEGMSGLWRCPGEWAAVAPLGGREFFIATNTLCLARVDLGLSSAGVVPMVPPADGPAFEHFNETWMTEVHRQGTDWWVCGDHGLVFRCNKGVWSRLAIEHEEWIHDVHSLGPDDTLLLTEQSMLRLRGTHLEEIEGVRPRSGEFVEIEEGRFRLKARGDVLWFTNGSDRIHTFSESRVQQIELPHTTEEYETFNHLDVGENGEIWVASQFRLLRGDGREWDLVWEHIPGETTECSISGMCAGRAGEAWVVDRDNGLFRATRGNLQAIDLGFSPRLSRPPVRVSGDRVSLLVTSKVGELGEQHLFLLRPGGPPRTRLTMRSNRCDNRADVCAETVEDVANRIAEMFGGRIDEDRS